MWPVMTDSCRHNFPAHVHEQRDLSHFFIFEFDSKSIVVWVVDLPSALWRFQNLWCACCYVFRSRIRWSISNISRTDNNAVNILTRMRSGGMNFIEFVIFGCLKIIRWCLSFCCIIFRY